MYTPFTRHAKSCPIFSSSVIFGSGTEAHMAAKNNPKVPSAQCLVPSLTPAFYGHWALGTGHWAQGTGHSYWMVALTIIETVIDGSRFACTSTCSDSAPAFARAPSMVTVIVSCPFGGSFEL